MTQKEKYYLTTPMYYPSDKLHIGHALTTVWADAQARYKRLTGYDVLFVTGTDEHGQKIADKANALEKTPQQFVDEIVVWIKDLWQKLDISYDVFRRTTDEEHVKAVQVVAQKLFDKGDIYKGEYKGWYCVPCESFWTENQLKDGKCPDCGRDVKLVKEDAYFLRLSKYQTALEKYYDENPEFILPLMRKHEMINNFLKPGLMDLCISRTTFDWGVRTPFDDKHIVYVWVDALLTYISAIGYSFNEGNFNKYWPADLQFIGKEIVRFHTIIWPIMLMALDLPLPKRVFAHGWLLFGGGKMSKSKGNVIDPKLLISAYGSDALRYYLLRESTRLGLDGDFTLELLRKKINYDLANDLGNLVSRTIAMIRKYFAGKIEAIGEAEDVDLKFKQFVLQMKETVEENMEHLDPNGAIEGIMQVVRRANKYIDETMPWVLAKDESQRQRLGTVLYMLAEALRMIAVALQPFMPKTAKKIFSQLGIEQEASLQSWETLASFGRLPLGLEVKVGPALFPRLDLKAEPEVLKLLKATPSAKKDNNKAKTKKEQSKVQAQITFETFSKVELRVAEVIAAEAIPKSEKLLKLRVSLGEEERQIVAGIAKFYQPEELVGKKVTIVANLKPARIFGFESQGMVLAVEGENGLGLLTPDRPVAPGSKIR